MNCAVCTHHESMHSLYEAGWCTWSKNPLSPSASIFCKCMGFVKPEKAVTQENS